MHLLLIRHGQSANNALEATMGAKGEEYKKSRSADPALSDLGAEQSRLLGKHLGAQLGAVRGRVRVLCSSMTRALTTAMPLARALGVRVQVRPDLFEAKGFFDASGRELRGPGRAALERICPGCDASLVPEEGQGAEAGPQTAARVQAVAGLLGVWAGQAGAEDEVVVIVSHNDFLCLLAQALLKPPAQRAVSEDSDDMFTESYWALNNTGISHLILGVRPRAYPAPAWLVYWNRTDHLPERLRSGIQYKSLGCCSPAAAWARVGEGGSGIKPAFVERDVVYELEPDGKGGRSALALALLLAAGAGSLLIAASAAARRRR